MEIKKKELAKILSDLKPGLAKREIIEEMTHFIFTKQRVLTFNDEITISHPFETDFACSVSAKDMIDGLNKAKSEKIKMSFEDGQLLLTCKDQDIIMNASMDDEVKEIATSVLHEASKQSWLPVPEDFTDVMYLAMFSASRDETDEAFQGICVSGKYVYSSDKVRLTQCEMKAPMEFFVVRAPVANDLRRFKLKNYCLTENWVNFRTEKDILFSVKKMGDDWPIEGALSFLKLEGSRFRLPDLLQPAAQDLITWTEGDMDFHKTIKVTFDNNLIVLEGRKETGLMRKRVMLEYQRDPITFLISPVYLAAILERGATRMIIGETRAAFKKDNMFHIMQLQVK